RCGRKKEGGAQDSLGASGGARYSFAHRLFACGFWRVTLFAIFGDRRRQTGRADVCRSGYARAGQERDVRPERRIETNRAAKRKDVRIECHLNRGERSGTDGQHAAAVAAGSRSEYTRFGFASGIVAE